jgi:hypothetical protein
LAGKRGVCPQCGARFDIPQHVAAAASDTTGDEIATVPATGEDALGGAHLETIAPAMAPSNFPFAKLVEAPADRGGPVDAATVDLDALAAAGGTSLLGGLVSGPGAKRLADRRKSAHRMRVFTLTLVVVATLLVCVLLYLVFRSK